jgi:phosphoglucosamine mutase
MGADAGLSFDGDADRLLFADETGRVVNGDRIMAIAGQALLAQGKLPGKVVVGTVMSNLGLERGLERMGMRLVRTQVGDRYVLEEMQRLGASLGGEQSGHVIFLDHATTGDGLVTGLLTLSMLRDSGSKLSQLADLISDYPQQLINVPVASVKGWDENPAICQIIAEAEADLGDEGRVLVRASGTEPKIRVMVEALQAAKVERWCTGIADVVRKASC